jgi:ribosomal protein S19E (S16A)
MTEQSKLSTTQLAKKHATAQNRLFAQLNALGLIQKDNDLRVMTEAGERRRDSLSLIGEVLEHKTLARVKRYAHLSEGHVSNLVASMNAKIIG